MPEFHHTMEGMIWVRRNQFASVQLRPIDYPDIPEPPGPLMRGVQWINPHAKLSEAGVESVYGDTLANFELDFGQRYEGLPAGIDERIYRQGKFHALNQRGVGTTAGGAMPWAYGDQAIAALPELLRRQADRQPPPPIITPPMILSHRQFYEVCALKGIITKAEALEAVRHGTMPAKIGAFLDQLPADQRFHAEMLLVGASTFERDHPMTDAIGHALGYTDEQMDDLWKLGMTL